MITISLITLLLIWIVTIAWSHIELFGFEFFEGPFDFWEWRWKSKFLKVFDIIVFTVFSVVLLVILAIYLSRSLNYYILFYEAN